MITDFMIIILLAGATGFSFALLINAIKKYLAIPIAKPKRKRKNDDQREFGLAPYERDQVRLLGQSDEVFARQKIARIKASALHVWENEAERRLAWAMQDILECYTKEKKKHD